MTHQTMTFEASPVVIEERPHQVRFSLRVRAQNREALARSLGLTLPERIGTRALSDRTEVLCLGPDEWLIAAPEGTDLARAAADVYSAMPHSLCEISDRETTLHLSGPQVVDLLTTACPRDIAAMTPGTAVRTVFDSATVVLWRDGSQDFRMDVWRSFLPHVRGILAKAEAELKAGL